MPRPLGEQIGQARSHHVGAGPTERILIRCSAARKRRAVRSRGARPYGRLWQQRQDSTLPQLAPNCSRREGAHLHGVVNATAVRLDPPVEKVWPAVARCFQVTPASTTRYTLTAEGAQRTTVSESIEIAVKP